MKLPKLTYGVELELSDWPWQTALPSGYGRDRKDITIVNSNGIANDPSAKYYTYGGEINTPPTDDPIGQVKCLKAIKKLFPMVTINYRSNLHIHVGVPGLRTELPALKMLQAYIHKTMPAVFDHIAPLPRPTIKEFPIREEFTGALRRWRRRRVSHRTLLTEKRLVRQLDAKTAAEFFRWEVPDSQTGTPLWHCQPRLCVNLRHLREKEETIEFRHFPGTLDAKLLQNCVCWCRDYLHWAINGCDIGTLLELYPTSAFPKFLRYEHELERRYRATVHDGTVSPEKIQENIKLILAWKFK